MPKPKYLSKEISWKKAEIHKCLIEKRELELKMQGVNYTLEIAEKQLRKLEDGQKTYG